MSKNIIEQLEQATSSVQKTWIITNALLKSLSNDLEKAAIAAAVPHWFDQAILAELLKVDKGEAGPLYNKLQALPFVERFGHLGGALHDLTRLSVISYLMTAQTETFFTYSRRAYEYFDQFYNAQNVVEATYHLLVIDKTAGLEQLKDRLKLYRETANFSAANNLIRNAEELIELNRLEGVDVAEIERQKYLMASEFIRFSQPEEMSEQEQEYLVQAIELLDPTGDKDLYLLEEPTQLHRLAYTRRRSFLLQKLNEAIQASDPLRQKIWLIELGNIDRTDNDFETALQRYNEALVLDETDKEAFVSRGETYRLMRHYEKALADFSRAIELDPNYAWALANRGEIYREMKRYEEALADFDRAVALRPDYAWAVAHRGQVYASLERYSSGRKVSERKEVHILVVDDSEPLRNLLRISLQKAGYTVYTASNGKDALEIFEQSPIDLVLVDTLMPNMNGYILCAELRKRSDVPIILLSALSRPDDIVYGFSLGADDYLTKPFQFREIETRIQAILHRVDWLKKRPNLNTISFSEITLDSETREVRVHGELVHLTPIEFQLLLYLMTRPDQPISKNELFQSVWGYDLVGDINLVEVAIRRVREKIEKNPSAPIYLLNVRGTGYKFNTQSVHEAKSN